MSPNGDFRIVLLFDGPYFDFPTCLVVQLSINRLRFLNHRTDHVVAPMTNLMVIIFMFFLSVTSLTATIFTEMKYIFLPQCAVNGLLNVVT